MRASVRSPEPIWPPSRARHRSLLGAAAALALSAIGLAASAAPPEPPAGGVTVEGVTVPGRPNREIVRKRADAFTAAVIARPTHGQALLRWRRPICPLVAGLGKDGGEFVLTRLSQIVADVGAPLAPRNCVPNVYLIVTDRPEALLRALRDRNRNLFGQWPPPKVRRIIAGGRPVRVWHNWDYSDAVGAALGQDPGRFAGAPTNLHANDTRLAFNALRNPWGSVVVVDARALKAVKLGQLADYVAMISLTEVNLDADLGDAPTILRLFDAAPGSAPDGLTGWDRALLSGLYHTDQASVMQRYQIVDRMVTDITSPEAPPPGH